MLKLSRKPGQSIRIGDDIEIVILSDEGVDEWPRPIRIGIKAPREVRVLRKELLRTGCSEANKKAGEDS